MRLHMHLSELYLSLYLLRAGRRGSACTPHSCCIDQLTRASSQPLLITLLSLPLCSYGLEDVAAAADYFAGEVMGSGYRECPLSVLLRLGRSAPRSAAAGPRCPRVPEMRWRCSSPHPIDACA